MVRYAKDQPAGFTNRIEKVAVVGVSAYYSCGVPSCRACHLLRPRIM